MYSGQRLDALDTRLVFKVYAMVVGFIGFFLTLVGVVEVYGRGRPTLFCTACSILMAAACCALGFEGIDDRATRRRALGWFTAAHGIVWFVLLAQLVGPRGPMLYDRLAEGMGIAVVVLFYLWMTSEGENSGRKSFSLFGAAPPSSTEQLRSQFEQQIRQTVRLEERNRLARDLHDSIKQQIFAIQASAATAQARFEGDQPGAKEALDQIRNSAREAMTEMQAMLDQLRAEPLENTGLIEAIRKQCQALEFRTGGRVEFTFGKLPPNEALAPGAHQAILRVAQEALANVGRHARATKVFVTLNATLDFVELKIRDDGAGFDPNGTRRGLGIASMQTRAEELGGKFELASRPGEGTSIEFAIPYAPAEKAAAYRRKAMLTAATLVVCLLILFRQKENPSIAAFSVINLIAFVRYIIAYRKTLRREAAQ